jgi:phosphonate transport system substrate-binding protein
VRADSTAEGVAALAGKPIAVVDRWSVTGFLLPAAQLREARIPFEPLFVGSHERVLAAVREGRAAAGATFVQVPAAPEGLRVLGSTGRIANEPLFVQAKLPAAEREALARALLGIRERELLEGLAGASGFRAPAEGAWSDARARVDAAGQRVTSLVHGGWQRANEHRRPLWSYAP